MHEDYYPESGDSLRFSYPLAAECKEHMTPPVREYKRDDELLSVHHPDTPGALDDAPDATALMLMGSARGAVGDVLFV